MNFGFLGKIFPVPKYLRMHAVGFDISDQSLKYVELARKNGNISVKKFGGKIIPQGMIVAGEIKDKAKLIDFLKRTKEELKIDRIITNLPEEKAFVSRVDLPRMEEEMIKGSLEVQIEEYVPLPGSEVIFDYEIIEGSEGGDGKNISVNVVAFPRAIVEDYRDVFMSAGIMPVAFEMEAQSLARAVVEKKDLSAHMIIDFGKTRTSFVLVDEGKVQFTSTINISGDLLTQTLMKDFNIDFFEAERIKKEYGFVKAKDSEKYFNSLLPLISAIIEEISRHLNYWNSRLAQSGKANGKIKKIFLSGGDSNLIGFPDFLAYQLRIPVELANPWLNIMSFEKQIPEIDLREALSYSVAIGLALKSTQ